MADNTGNFISKFAPHSCFFTTPGILTQTATQAFGPVDENHYRLTANFDLPVGSPAYAVCSGVILIQPQSGDGTKVNLILRPFKQPIQGFNIKYFVYRGLSLASFFSGDTVLPNADGASDLVKKTNQSFKDFYTKFYKDQPVPALLAKYLGYDPVNQAGDLLIDDLFFKQAMVKDGVENPGDAFELPLLQMGDSLGLFAENDCGMDVVISYGDYKLPQPNDEFVFDLKYARAADWTIDVSGESNDFRKKQIKEQIFQFLDVAAYYGFHANDLGIVTIGTGDSKTTKKGTTIYTDLLQGFQTKNDWYVYIQSNRSRSYNFYGNYLIEGSSVNSLKLGVTPNNLIEQPYSTKGWPLLIDNNIRSARDEKINRLYLQLFMEKSASSGIWGQIGIIENARTKNFLDEGALRLPNATNDTQPRLTREIILNAPAIGTTGDQKNLSTFTTLLYQSGGDNLMYRISSSLPENPKYPGSGLELPNEVFGSPIAEPLRRGEENQLSIAFQRANIINHIESKKLLGISAAYNLRINDSISTGRPDTTLLPRVTYLTEMIDNSTNSTSISNAISSVTHRSNLSTNASDGNNTTKDSNVFFNYTLKKFTESEDSVNGILLMTIDESTPGSIVLGLTREENETLKSLCVDGDNYRIVLIHSLPDGNNYISKEDIIYYKYFAAVIKETSTGNLDIDILPDEVVIYSLDQKCFFSKAYSQYMHDQPITNISLDTDIAI